MLIWRGNRKTRALAIRGSRGRPIFFVAGAVVPEDAIPAELADRYISEGIMERIASSPVITRSIAATTEINERQAPEIEPTPVRNDYSIATNDPIFPPAEQTVPSTAPRRKYGLKKKRGKNGEAE